MADRSIRPIAAGEGAFIVELHALPHVRDLLIPPTRDQVEEGIRRGSAEQWIVVDGDERVGMVVFAFIEPWLVEVRRMIAKRPGTGVGWFLLKRVAAHAFGRDAHRLYLEVHAKNTRARALYERFGFVYEGTYRDGAKNPLTGDYEDLCIYGMLEREYRRLPHAGSST
jgi:RimJ/RimL family protein N-acetyltransferase